MSHTLMLKLLFDLDDHEMTYSLLQLVLRNLEKVERDGIELEYVELRLEKTGRSTQPIKAYIKMDSHKRTITNSATASRWDDAFLNVFEKARHELFQLESEDEKLYDLEELVLAV